MFELLFFVNEFVFEDESVEKINIIKSKIIYNDSVDDLFDFVLSIIIIIMCNMSKEC